MKIIEQSHEILDTPSNPLLFPEIAARNCYDSYAKIGCLELSEETLHNCSNVIWDEYGKQCLNTKCSAHSSHRLIKALIKKGHASILEFSNIIIKLITNRGVMAEITRHRIGISFAIQSTRYVKYDNIEFIKPVWFKDCRPNEIAIWERAMLQSENNYRELLSKGWQPEQAREVLPNSLKTEIIMQGNYRSFRHLFKLRTSKAAHPQLRNLLTPLLAELKEQTPVIFDDIGE